MSDWRQVQLGQIADVRVSNVDKKTLPGEIAVRLCNYMDVYSNDYIRDHLSFMPASATIGEIARFKVECGDVLITKDSETPDDIGIPTVVVDEINNLVCGYHVALLKPNKSVVDPVYLCKQLGRAESAGYFARYAAGSTRYGLPMGAMMRTPIALAPLAQQQKIATILSTIDTAIEQTEALIEKYQHIKAGLMHDLFTRGVLPTGQLRPPREHAPELYQETAIGWIPNDWRVTNYGSQVQIIDPNPSHRYPNEVAEGVPICSTENFDGADNFDLSRANAVPHQSYVDQNNRCRFEANDVVFARKGRIGLARRYGETKKVFSHTVVLFKPKTDGIDAKWLLWAARSFWFLGAIDRTMNSNSGVPTLGVDFISKVSIPFPGIYEQSIAAQKLDGVSIKLSSLQQDLEKLKAKKLGLMQDLLTGKVPVTVDAPPSEAAA